MNFHLVSSFDDFNAEEQKALVELFSNPGMKGLLVRCRDKCAEAMLRLESTGPLFREEYRTLQLEMHIYEEAIALAEKLVEDYWR